MTPARKPNPTRGRSSGGNRNPKVGTDELTKHQETLYHEAELAQGINAEALRRMSLLAHDYRRDKDDMKFLTSLWGRNARHLATAVARWPAWFTGMDDAPPITAEPDEILALWLLAQFPKGDAEHYYQLWRLYSWRSWQIRERLELWRQRRSTRAAPIKIVIKSARVVSATAAAKMQTITLAWGGQEPLMEPETWLQAEVGAIITLQVKE